MSAPLYRHREPAVIEAYKRGDTLIQIAAMMGINKHTANKHLSRAADEGLIQRRLPRWSEKDRDTALRLHKEGLSYLEIGAAMGKTKEQIAGQMTRFLKGGKRDKRPSVWTPERDAELKRRVVLSTYRETAKSMGITVGSVASRAAKLGLKPVKRDHVWMEKDSQYLRDSYRTTTQREMAAFLGVHSSTISVRLKALGLKSPVIRGNRQPVTYLAPKAAKAEPSNVIPSTARPWLTRLRGECNYPYGERGDIHSCCAPVWRGTGMCEDHAALCGGYHKVAA